MKDLFEEVGRERAGKEKAVEAVKEKMKIAESAEKRVAAAEKSRALAKKKLAELKRLLTCGRPLKHVRISSTMRGLPMVMQARQLSFWEGWMAALQALGVPEDSPLRDPDRIPIPVSVLAAQNPAGLNEEEETDSLRELMEQIDAHVEMIRVEVTSNPPTEGPQGEDVHSQPPVPERHTVEITSETQPVDLSS